MAVNSITFGGVNSADFGIYISGEGVFNAPKRDVEMIAIPGRNGELALDKGRFENIEVTYPAFNFEPNDYETFAKNLSDFRNAICSLRGYQRLADTFHPDEYRMATYIGGLEIKPIKYNTASEFSIIFDCKPQRYLTDGETPITLGEWGEVETVSGDIVEIDNLGIEAVKSLSVELEPIQSGSGTPSPDNVRPISGRTECEVDVTGKNLLNPHIYKGINYAPTIGSTPTITDRAEQLTDNGDGTFSVVLTSPWTSFDFVVPIKTSETYHLKIKVETTGTANGVTWGVMDASGTVKYAYNENVLTVTHNRNIVPSGYTSDENGYFFIAISNRGSSVPNTITITEPQLELGSTATAYEPYQGDTYTTDLGRTVYGGTLDVVSGILTVTHAYVVLNGSESYTQTASGLFRFYPSPNMASGRWYDDVDTICDTYAKYDSTSSVPNGSIVFGSGNNYIYIRDDRASTVDEFKALLANENVGITYPLATPQTYQLTGQDIELIEGSNYIWSDSGDVTVEHGQNPNYLVNPTRFESSPLLMVEGYGTIGFNGYEIELEDAELGTVTIANRSTTTTVTIPQGILNTGDTITVGETEFSWSISALNGRYFAKQEPTATDSNEAFSTTAPSLGLTGRCPFTTIADAVTFSYGTASSVTNTATSRITLAGGSITHLDVSSTQTISYDGDSTITFSHTATVSPSTDASASADGRTHGAATGYSTISMLGHPTYVDCDYGEAYMIKDGSIVSLNRYIDLGSDLPKLGVGQNEVTADNTVTELQIAPRWWRV